MAALVNGDVYPSFMAMLRGEGGTRALSSESVNVAAGVARTKTGWIGLNMYVMCPTDGTARELIPALAAVLKKYGFEHATQGVLAQLREAERCKTSETKEEDLWPKAAGPLHRHGVHRGG